MNEKEFRKFLRKVMRRKANQCKDWISFNLDDNNIRFYSKIRGNEWNMPISEFVNLNQ